MTPYEENPVAASSEPELIRRRGVLGALGLAGFGLLASSSIASAFTSADTEEGPEVSVPTASRTIAHAYNSNDAFADLPEQWAEANATLVPSYLRYLNTLNLQRVCPKQVLEAHAKAKGSIWNTLPPHQWWNRIGYVLKVVDRVAKEMNVSQVEVISAYRCPAYNAHCPGAKAGSWHQANVAADVKFPVRASQVTRTARELRNLGLFRGGVGGYWDFTHIDARGHNVDW